MSTQATALLIWRLPRHRRSPVKAAHRMEYYCLDGLNRCFRRPLEGRWNTEAANFVGGRRRSERLPQLIGLAAAGLTPWIS